MKNNLESQKEFGISSWAVNNRKTVYLIVAIILFGGIMSYVNMPKENFPELQIPEIYVGVAYPWNSPELISDKIVDPLEKELNSIKNVDEIKSTSTNGYATLQIKFDFKVTAKEALQEVKDAVDKARATKDFPKDLPVEPNIFEMDVSEMPIMNINLSGNYSIDRLKEYGEILEKKIESLEEISKVEIRGIQEKEMKIEVDPQKAEAVNVSFGDIQSAIESENITMSGGEYLDGSTKRTIQIEGKFKNAAQIGNVIVKREDAKAVYLKDIAEISFSNSDITSFAREWGDKVVMLDVKKRGGHNLLIASDKINEILVQAKKDRSIPEALSVSITNDQSGQTREMVSNLENSIIFGIILVVGVLLFFLGLRNAIFVGVAIPMSMFMSFLILSSMGVTLNTMVLFSLVLALGMLVDNGIVVVENVQRLMEEGYDSFTSVKKGVGEVAWPIIASTATTLGAFIPLAIWPGIMGEFMKYLPITLMIVLGSSLFVALVINPVFTAMWMKVEQKHGNKKRTIIISIVAVLLGLLLIPVNTGWSNIFLIIGVFAILNFFAFDPATVWFQTKFLPVLENKYEKLLKFSLHKRRPVAFFLGTFGLLFLSFVIVGAFAPKVLFFPENQPKYVNIYIQHPVGTDINVTNNTTLEVEGLLKNDILKGHLSDTVNKPYEEHIIQSIIAQVGAGTSDNGVSMGAGGNTPHKARITVNFPEFKFRGNYVTSEIMAEIADGLKNKFPADVSISVEPNNFGPPTAPPINIQVSGELDYDVLLEEANKLRLFLDRKNIPGVDKLKLDVERGKPELPIYIDRDKARLFNTSSRQIASAIRTALFGSDISTFKDGDEIYDIAVRFKGDQRYDLDALLDQKLIFRNNKGKILRIPIRSLVKDPKPTNTYSSVVHKDLVPVVTIYSKVSAGANPNEVLNRVMELADEYENDNEVPAGVDFAFTGEREEQAEEMAFLSKALFIAVFIILLIIVAQFNAFSSPVIILFAVVFSLIGVLLGEVIFQMDFVIMMTMIGIISLAGVVVNNAIVLIDYTNLLRKRRREELGLNEFEHLPLETLVEIIVEAGKVRLRPVLLTAITTILGLVPLAVGINIDFTTLLTEYNANFYIGGDNTMFFGPMSWTIIFGLTFATFLTLILVPVMYLIFYRFKMWLFKITKTRMRTSL